MPMSEGVVTGRVLPVSIAGLLALAGCGDAAEAVVVGAEEVLVMEQSAAIQGRDGGSSSVLWGQSVWAYGDTVLNVPDVEGETWHHNSFSMTGDLVASDGITGFVEPTDAAGAPAYFIPPTEEEAAFNAAHRGDPCAESPCGARWAVWPGVPAYDAARDRAVIPYGLIYAEPGDFNFRQVGQSFAIWSGLTAVPERPVVSPGTAHPTLLFHEGEPYYGNAILAQGDLLYAFDCSEHAGWCCTLGRVALADVLDRSAWTYWDGDDWVSEAGDAEALFEGSPILSVAYNEHLGRWTAVYSGIASNDVHMRTAPEITGPWSDSIVLFTADRKTDEGWVYDANLHPEYSEESGRILYITHSRPTGEGWFGAEFAVVRVELE